MACEKCNLCNKCGCKCECNKVDKLADHVLNWNEDALRESLQEIEDNMTQPIVQVNVKPFLLSVTDFNRENDYEIEYRANLTVEQFVSILQDYFGIEVDYYQSNPNVTLEDLFGEDSSEDEQ